MMYDWNGWAWWWMVPMMLLMLAAVVAVVWAIVQIAQPSSPSRATPEEVLARRLASGEIDTDEYRQRLDALHDTLKR